MPPRRLIPLPNKEDPIEEIARKAAQYTPDRNLEVPLSIKCSMCRKGEIVKSVNGLFVCAATKCHKTASEYR